MNLDIHSEGENMRNEPLSNQRRQQTNLISTEKSQTLKFDKKVLDKHPMDFSTEHLSEKSDTLLHQDHLNELVNDDDASSSYSNPADVLSLSHLSNTSQSKKGCCANLYLFNLFKTYDNRFLFALGLQYLNTGMKSMTTLAFLDLFRVRYALEPNETQSFTALMALSWTPKLFYGIISDTFPIYGTRKKSYLVLMGLLQFSTSWAIAAFPNLTPSSIAILGFFLNLATAFMDVVVDGLMVM